MRLIPSHLSKEEFACKWEASRTKMYRFAYCYVKNEHDAMEILSDATCKAYCSMHQLKNPEQFDTWMGRIIINISIDFIRHRNRFTADETDVEELGETEHSPWEALEDKLDVYAALDSLPPKERALIILKYFEEKSFKEIGELMEIPEATVKTKVYRALEKMRSLWNRTEGIL